MRRWWWNVRFVWEMARYTGWRFAWYSAKAWEQEEADDYTPVGAVNEDMCHWYD